MDPEEFKNRALPLFNQLYKVALGLSRNEEEAMDLVQDTYLKALSAFSQFTPGTNMRAWLFRILYNTFVNEYHRKERIENFDEDRFIDPGGDPSEEALKELMEEEIEKALRELPDEYRSAILLVDLGGLTYEEAGDALGCPLGTVRSRLSRAREILRNKLLRYAQERGIKK